MAHTNHCTQVPRVSQLITKEGASTPRHATVMVVYHPRAQNIDVAEHEHAVLLFGKPEKCFIDRLAFVGISPCLLPFSASQHLFWLSSIARQSIWYISSMKWKS